MIKQLKSWDNVCMNNRAWHEKKALEQTNRRRISKEEAQSRYDAAMANPDSNLRVQLIRRGVKGRPDNKSHQQKILDLEDKVKRLENIIKSLQGNQGKVNFYDTEEWRKLRYEALKRSNGRCQLCGNGREQGAILQVDHIKPRSKHPELEHDPSNLQVLCKPCNLGKSNRDSVDWRLRVIGGK